MVLWLCHSIAVYHFNIMLTVCWFATLMPNKCGCETRCEIHHNYISFTGMAIKHVNTLLLSVRVKLTNFIQDLTVFDFENTLSCQP